jgi:hypothetical protein
VREREGAGGRRYVVVSGQRLHGVSLLCKQKGALTPSPLSNAGHQFSGIRYGVLRIFVHVQTVLFAALHPILFAFSKRLTSGDRLLRTVPRERTVNATEAVPRICGEMRKLQRATAAINSWCRPPARLQNPKPNHVNNLNATTELLPCTIIRKSTWYQQAAGNVQYTTTGANKSTA